MNARLLTVLVPSRCWVFQDCHKSVGKQSRGLVVVMEEKEEKEGEKRDVLFLCSELLKLYSPRKTNAVNREQ